MHLSTHQRKQLDLMRQMEQRFTAGSQAATIVPAQTDYAKDLQMCLSVNTFVPAHIARIIQTNLIEPLKRIDPTQYYYPSESLHITLHSVRIIHDPPTYTSQDIETSKQLLAKLVPKEHAFPFILSGVLSLPTSVAVIALATPEYDRFVRMLRHAFVDAGIPDDKTYFTNEMVFANTTICRYTHKPTQEFLEKLATLKETYVGSFVAKNVALLETNACAYPSKTTIFSSLNFKPL